MKTSIPSQKLVVQVNPMKMLCSCYVRLYGCHGILGGVISVCRLLYVDDHQAVVLEHNAVSSLSFQLGLCVHIILGIIGGLKH